MWVERRSSKPGHVFEVMFWEDYGEILSYIYGQWNLDYKRYQKIHGNESNCRQLFLRNIFHTESVKEEINQNTLDIDATI